MTMTLSRRSFSFGAAAFTALAPAAAHALIENQAKERMRKLFHKKRRVHASYRRPFRPGTPESSEQLTH